MSNFILSTAEDGSEWFINHEQYFTVGEYYEISYTSGNQYAFYGIDSEYQVFGPKEYFV